MNSYLLHKQLLNHSFDECLGSKKRFTWISNIYAKDQKDEELTWAKPQRGEGKRTFQKTPSNSVLLEYKLFM